MVSPLELAIRFLEDFGLFRVVLPFLLVFTIMFAILEKTRILGTEKIKGETVPNKSLNAMFSFVVALFVVATPSVVDFLQLSLPRVLLVLVILISFMLLAGSLLASKEVSIDELMDSNFKMLLIFVLFLGVVLISMSALYTESGETWLQIFINWIVNEWSGAIFGSAILFIIMIAAVFIIIGKGSGKSKEENK